MNNTMINLESVSKEYLNQETGRNFRAMSDLNLTVSDKEFICLIGPSGCGKSTLLNMIAGFIKPSEGTITVDGRKVVSPGPDRGVVFQDPWLFPWLTVLENVEFGLAAMGVRNPEKKNKSLEHLKAVGLDGYENQRPHMLSGGQKQRVALARVLALSPKVLLMDEPFSALDANTRERMQDELLRLWRLDHKTVFFVTHQVEEAAYLADRVLVMGQPPRGILNEYRIDLPRPRGRSSEAQRQVVSAVRKELDGLPCCIPPEGGGTGPVPPQRIITEIPPYKHDN